MNSLQRPTRSRPVREFRTSGVKCVGGLFNSSIVRTQPLSLKDGRKSERVASLSSAAAGLLRDFFKSSSGALHFKKSLRRQGIGFRRCPSDRSRPLTGCQRYCGRRRLLASPSTFAMSITERLVNPRFTGLAAREARLATPYGQDWHGLHYADAPLRPHQTCRK